MVAEGIVVLFKDFGDNALVFDVEFWIEISSERDKQRIESDVRFKIDELARAGGSCQGFWRALALEVETTLKPALRKRSAARSNGGGAHPPP
jgi:hypothetical protein